MPLRHEFSWGLGIGFGNLLWLYGSYYAGLHTGGILLFQVVPAGWLLLTVTGFVLALRSLRRTRGSLTFRDGVRSGTVIALVSAGIAVLAQIGYFTVIHPEWPAYMQQATREYFVARGVTAEEVARRVDEASRSFSLGTYAAQSGLTALIGGVLVSMVYSWIGGRRATT